MWLKLKHICIQLAKPLLTVLFLLHMSAAGASEMPGPAPAGAGLSVSHGL